MQKRNKFFLTFLVLALLIASQFSLLAPVAEAADSGLWSGQTGLGSQSSVKNTFGGNEDPRLIVAKVINVLLSFLGIIFLALLIWGGYKYMLSRGNEEEVEGAIKIIRNAIIGIFLVLAAWAIADFTADCVLDITQGSSIWMCK